jgi:hypothetical protein
VCVAAFCVRTAKELEVIETYRMLGKQREDDLLREARRLKAGEAAKGVRRRPRGRHLEAVRGRCAALLTRMRTAKPAATAE